MNTLTAPATEPAQKAPPWAPNRGAADAITLSGVFKSYRAVPAVRDLSLTIRRGETTALLGPNGAGKSTTIGMILGLLAPDRGTISVLGSTPEHAVAAGRVGAMLQDGGMMSGVRVAELLRMLASLYPNPMRVEHACAVCQLDGLEGRRVDRLSGGQTQKLRLAVSLVGNPDLLILDEPTAGMDVEARRRFWTDMNAEADRGRTILFSTHYLEEADTNSDRIVVVANGSVVADGTPEAVKDSVGLRAVRFSAPRAAALDLSTLPAVTTSSLRGDRVEICSTDTDAVLRAVIRQWPAAHDFEISGIGLEDAFIALTESGAQSASTASLGDN
ncbi:MAG: ABC transporter ATP-binding protein [Candidatus Dormibacteria bacterium]